MSTVSGSTPGGNVSGEVKSQTALLIVPTGGSVYKEFVWERNDNKGLIYQTLRVFISNNNART